MVEKEGTGSGNLTECWFSGNDRRGSLPKPHFAEETGFSVSLAHLHDIWEC